MSLEQPSQSNDYTLHPDHKMSVSFWQDVLSELHGRLNTLEAVATDWDEALADKATEIAEETFENSVAPQLAQVQDEITALSDAIALAEDQLAVIQQGGILAESVVLDPELDGLAGVGHVRAAIAEVVARTAAVGTGNEGKFLKNTGSGAAWEDVPETEFASQAEAEAGTNNDTAMTPLRTAQAIAAQVPGDNVVQAVKTDTATVSSATYVDTGLELSITTQRDDSKVLLIAHVNAGAGAGNQWPQFVFVRGSTIVRQADAAGDRRRGHFGFRSAGTAQDHLMLSGGGSIIDEPGPAGTYTYKLQWLTLGSGTGYLNRPSNDPDNDTSSRGISTLIAQEIAQ